MAKTGYVERMTKAYGRNPFALYRGKKGTEAEKAREKATRAGLALVNRLAAERPNDDAIWAAFVPWSNEYRTIGAADTESREQFFGLIEAEVKLAAEAQPDVLAGAAEPKRWTPEPDGPFGPVESLADLASRARTDGRYRALAEVAAENLGHPVKNLDEAMDWLRKEASESSEENLIPEINAVRDLVTNPKEVSVPSKKSKGTRKKGGTKPADLKAALEGQAERLSPTTAEPPAAAPESAPATAQAATEPIEDLGRPHRIFKSPFTSKVYDMDTTAGKAQFRRQYGRFVAAGWALYHCEHKHQGCSIFDDGPCSDEFAPEQA